MANYKLPGPGAPSVQGPWDPSLIRFRNGQPRLMTPYEEFLEKSRVDGHGCTNEKLELILSDRFILTPVCERAQKYVAEIPETDPNRANHLLVLGHLLQRQAEISGHKEDLELCLQYLKQAINITPEGHPKRAECLMALAYNSLLQSRNTFQMADADKALQYGQQAINAITKGQSSREFLVTLGSILQHRYAITNQIADLQHGIQYLQAALEAPQTDHGKNVHILNNLGNIHRVLFSRTNRGDDIELAIQYGQEAVKTPPDGGQNLAILFNNLALSLFSRSKISLWVADINMAIEYGQQALASTSLSDSNYAGYLRNLGIFFKRRFHRTRQVADLDQAIRHEETLKYTSSNDEFLASHRFNYGVSFQERAKLTRKREDLVTSLRAFTDGLWSEGVPFDRLRCGFEAAKIATSVPGLDTKPAVAIVEETLEIIPHVFERTGSRNDTQHILQRLSGLASFLASILFAANISPPQVLQRLENSRGMITGLVIDVRSDAIGLKEKHPEIWWRYTQCRNFLGAMNSNVLKMGMEQNYAMNVKRLGQLHKDLSDMKEEIRKYPGFERFLLSPTEIEMRELARNGPIVSFNVSYLNSAAFLVMASGIQSLPLSALKFKEVLHWVKTFASYGNSTRRDAKLCEDDEEQEQISNQRTPSKMKTGLSYLWTTAVKPVLQQLKLLNHVDSPTRLPQIWWVGGGIMGLLPLHAAGDHSSGSTENTISHVVSSYAPTFKSLQFIQNRPRVSISQVKQELLLVAMPTTPGGHKPLKVIEEVTAIENSTLKWASSTALVRPYKADVVDALKTCAIAHFACHGTADRVEPAKSALLIGKEAVETLTIEDLDAISCQNAQIVYLSACSTAEIGVMNLADESIHLASSFQLAGFRHVIGTLWGADDDAAVEVAKNFYKDLPQYSENGYVSAARALHDAVISFRNTRENWKNFSKWAPFIHLGC